MNASLLQDETYIPAMKSKIEYLQNEYNFLTELRVKRELIKFKICDYTLKFSKKRARERRILDSEIQTRRDK